MQRQEQQEQQKDNYSGCQGYCADEARILVQKRNNHCCHILLDYGGIKHAIRYFRYHTGCRIYNDHCDPARQTCFQLGLNYTLKYNVNAADESDLKS
eukprot:scaffold10173_cov281-Chaetoceros_neogracile.AAC.13